MNTISPIVSLCIGLPLKLFQNILKTLKIIYFDNKYDIMNISMFFDMEGHPGGM